MNERTIFLNALEIPEPVERQAYLDQACAGDVALRQNVAALIKSHEQASGFLEKPAVEQMATSAFAPETPSEAKTPTDVIDREQGKSARAGTSEETQGEWSGLGDHDLSFLAAATKPGGLGRLGHYEIQAVIGKGGFGIVLKGFDERLHRVVAIKVLAPVFAANGSARKRFIREARAAAAVKNEHVVGIYDVQEEAQPPFLVMECIDGISLQDKLDKHGTLGIKEILRIGMQIAEGLTAAHKQGLVHRDIKPANILLENGVERVKITDFGLARAVDDASVTQSGTVAGTPMYMSPEQAEGIAVDHRSDLFSLGTVLYAMCTGHPPFRAAGTHAVLKRVIEASPRPIREINSEIPDWLCDIIAKLHAKKPADRFQTANEVAELLGRHLAHLQQPTANSRPAPVAVPPNAKPDPLPTDKNVWTQIFEGTDYRRRLIQYALLLTTSLPALLILFVASRGIVTQPGEGVSTIVVLIAAGVFHVLWSIGFLIASMRVKNRWQVDYKGRVLQLEFTVFGSERLYLDGALLARCSPGFTFQELQAAIPAGPGAGDKIRVLGQFGFLTPTCRLYASEGSPPTLALTPSTWARIGKHARPLAYAASIILPVALFIWFAAGQRHGYISLKADDPELVVILDGQILRSGEGPDTEINWNMKFQSLRIGQHTLQASKRGKVLFDESFDLAFGETREFDFTRAALGINSDFVRAGLGGPGWNGLYNSAAWMSTGDFTSAGGEFQLWPDCQLDTKEKFPRDFHLRMEVRLASGEGTVRFRAQPRVLGADTPPPKDGWFLNFTAYDGVAVSCTLDTKDGAGGKHTAGNIAARGDWFYLEIVSKDGKTEVLVDGKKKIAVQHMDSAPSAGILTLWNSGQIGRPGASDSAIAFRYIEFKDLTPPDATDLMNREKLKLQGDWHLVAGEDDGKPLPEPLPPDQRILLQFAGDQVKVSLGKDAAIQGAYRIDPTQTPATLDFSDVFVKIKLHAIYRRDGDKLIICAGDNRPTDFSTKLGDGRILLICVRRSRTEKAAEPGWIPLFNGKDLTGWELDPWGRPRGDAKWEVNKGVLRGSAKNGTYGSLMAVEKNLANFRLKTEVRVEGKGNAQLRFRSNRNGAYVIELSPEKAGHLVKRTEAASHEILDPLEQKPDSKIADGKWYTLEIHADGKFVTTEVNGKKVAFIANASVFAGEIELHVDASSDKGPCMVEFRNMLMKRSRDAELLQGIWESVELQANGKLLSLDHFEQKIGVLERDGESGKPLRVDQKHLEIVGDVFQSLLAHLSTKGGGTYRTTGTITLDPTAKPSQFEIKTIEGFDVYGIYKLEPDTLTLCYRSALSAENDRPTEFKTTPESGTVLYRFKRIPKAGSPAWMPLFNGKDFDGWKAHVPGDKVWAWENGTLVARTSSGTSPPARLESMRTFKDFELRFQARILDSEMYLRLRKNKLGSKLGFTPITFGKGKWGSVPPNIAHMAQANEFTLKGVRKFIKEDDYNDVAITCVGDRIIVKINGMWTYDGTVEGPREGAIEWAVPIYNSQVYIRKIEIKELPPPPIAEKGVLDFAEIHDADDKRFDDWIAKMKKDGFRPVCLSVQATPTRPRYTATALRSTAALEWDFFRAFGDQEEVGAHLKAFLSKRFKIAAHAVIIEEKLGLAVLWVRDDRVGFQEIWEGPDKRITEKVDEGTRQGQRVLHRSAVVEAGQPNFVVTLIDARGIPWKESINSTRDQFQAWVESHKKSHWRLDNFCSYGSGANTRFAGVLIQDANGPDWDISWGLTPAQYEAELATRKNQGFRPQAVGHEDDTGALRFSVIWIRYRLIP